MNRPWDLRLLVVVLGLLLSGCAGHLHPDELRPFDRYDYMKEIGEAQKCSATSGATDPECALTGKYVLIHKDGYALTPDDRPAARKEFKNQLDRITDGIDHHATLLSKNGCGNTIKILLFVHGGLNGHDASVKRMTEWVRPGHLLAESCYYPIFIAWDSAIGSSVWDDIVGLRFGQRPQNWFDRVYSWITAPVVLTSRLVSAMGNLPVAMGHSLYNTGGGIKAALNEEAIDGQRGNPWWTLLDAGVYQTLLPFQLVTTPLLEGLGTPAWQIMKRRASLAVAPRLPNPDASIFDFRPSLPGQSAGAGAGWDLLSTLRSKVTRLRDAHRADPEKPDVSITLVGHSMGAMLLDRIVAIAADTLPFANIVYLAPAASIDDVAHTVLTYLHRQEVRGCFHQEQLDRLKSAEQLLARVATSSSHTPDQAAEATRALRDLAIAKARAATETVDTRLWIFTLNARDEAREVAHPYEWLLWAFPRGSLLQWIDGYFEPNTTRGETTSGKELNIASYRHGEPSDVGCRDGHAIPGVKKAPVEPTEENATGIPDFRRVPISIPGVGDNRVRIYHAQRPTNTIFTKYTNAPEEHSDFTAPRFVAQVLCRVDRTAFPKDYCRRGVRALPPDLTMPQASGPSGR